MHTILGFSFATTLMIANATSVAWLLCYYLLLKPAVNTLFLLNDHLKLLTCLAYRKHRLVASVSEPHMIVWKLRCACADWDSAQKQV